MNLFFERQMDYIFFIYGLAFLIMAAVCITMRREERRLPWVYLGLFGVTHGFNEWLDLIAITLGDNPVFTASRIFVMIVSFLFLLEFGRSGLLMVKRKGPGRWIYLPLLLVALIGGTTGWSGLNAASRYALGLVGGISSVLALLLASRGLDNSERRALVSGGIGMGLYAVATGAVVPPALFFPATLLNQAFFLNTFGFPIQLVRGVFAVWIASSIWIYSQVSYGQGIEAEYKELRGRFSLIMALSVILIVALGWVMTDFIGNQRDVVIYRLASINGVCVLSVLMISFFVMWQRAKESYLKIEALSLKDPLTGLANRRMMDIMLDRLFLEAMRYGRNLSVIMADLDHFKKYNDTHGHQSGDRLLAGAAGILMKSVRDSDLVTRYGGEEFLLILPETGISEACISAERVRKRFEEKGEVTISMGVSTFHAGVEDKERLIKEADEALYRAKEGGRNRVEVALGGERQREGG
jgi:diguanylate cyclase (GGDEF)-like protein